MQEDIEFNKILISQGYLDLIVQDKCQVGGRHVDTDQLKFFKFGKINSSDMNSLPPIFYS